MLKIKYVFHIANFLNICLILTAHKEKYCVSKQYIYKLNLNKYLFYEQLSEIELTAFGP